MTNDEINELVARKLGHTPQDNDYSLYWKMRGRVKVLPDYCRDIQAAWEITPYLDIRKFTDWPTPLQICEAFLAKVP